jgi:hypothetical protein
MSGNAPLDRMTELTARVLAIRDVVARLLAYESARWEEPALLFNDISDTTAKRIYDLMGKRNLTPATIALQEFIQKEVDFVVTMAQKMATPEDES